MRTGAGNTLLYAVAAAVIGGTSLFGGKGKISNLMGDAAKGVRAFRDGLKDGDEDKPRDERAGALPRTDEEKEQLKQ